MGKIFEDIRSMHKMADMLIPYSYPLVDFDYEQEMLCLKQRSVTVDGYELVVSLSKADYEEYVMESLQIQSYHAPYLPFNLVCKVATAFLGSKGLSYIDFFKQGKKVYCWTVKRRDGDLVPIIRGSRPGFYEGLEFRILNPGSVDLLDG